MLNILILSIGPVCCWWASSRTNSLGSRRLRSVIQTRLMFTKSMFRWRYQRASAHGKNALLSDSNSWYASWLALNLGTLCMLSLPTFLLLTVSDVYKGVDCMLESWLHGELCRSDLG